MWLLGGGIGINMEGSGESLVLADGGGSADTEVVVLVVDRGISAVSMEGCISDFGSLEVVVVDSWTTQTFGTTASDTIILSLFSVLTVCTPPSTSLNDRFRDNVEVLVEPSSGSPPMVVVSV